MEVGFIGLGLMGRPMALNLLKAGHRLHVWSRREASLKPLVEAGAKGCGSARELAQAAEVVISMVADAPDVEKVALGADGVADGAGPQTIFVDMSTIAPSAARSIAWRLAERGVRMLDAPVSGGEAGAIAGTLT
ncbi:MAG: NAD(P)-binding domain-containing protein, partial [Rhodocyclaceae bacterium]|nr:NAD(P)-binding domain-containing protein [Rhodocyclaceae bacterium]